MQRREFIGAVGASAGLGAVAQHVAAATASEDSSSRPVIARGERFKLAYAPHFGMFKNSGGSDLVDQLKFAADEGFWAWEDNGMMGRPIPVQERVGAAMTDLGMSMGVFVADAHWSGPLYAMGGAETRKALQEKMRKAVEVADRVNATWMTVVPGKFDPGLEWDYQTANVVDCLKAMAEICEPSGKVIVIEPLNPYRDHPGMFLSKIPQAYLICRAVNSPSCKVLDDLYHQQITEGNLIPNMDMAWDEIAYFQVGDNPGRMEPTTGEINYRNVFKHIDGRGFKGIVGMEHGNSRDGKEGERAVIDAYRWCDGFQV